MTALLYRIGAYAHRRHWRVLAGWGVLAALLIVLGFGFGGKLVDSFSIPGTESQAALDRLGQVFPQTAGASAQFVMVAKQGETVDDTDQRAAIDDTVAAINKIDRVASVTSPFSQYATHAVSSDRSAVIVSIQFSDGATSVPATTADAVAKTVSIGQKAGMTVAYHGTPFTSKGVAVSATDGLGVVFAAVVLVVTFGSLLTAGMPLLTAILGVALSAAIVRIIALFTDVSTSAPTLALMLGLAVGIDYGLFIASRHRQQLANGMEVGESIATAVATAGTAVAFAGITVIIALLGLAVVNIPFLTLMGVGAAFAVALAVLGSVTLMPALFSIGGARFAPKPNSKAAKRAIEMSAGGELRTGGARWVGLLAKVPALGVILPIVLLGLLAIPAGSLQLSLPNDGQQPKGTQARIAYDLIAEHFGAGSTGPLIVLADITKDDHFTDDLATMATRLKALPDVASVGTATPNATLDTAILQVIPKSGPASDSTTALVKQIRGLESEFKHDYDIQISVTGTTAIQSDISQRLLDALVPFALVVVGLSMILLLIVFRSFVVPIKAALGFLLSFFAALGLTVWLVQDGAGESFLNTPPGPLLSFMPILVMAIMFGLSMDYEVFLVSGMRESFVHEGEAKPAVRHGFAHGARVVTAAALIMTFVFVAFIPDGSATIKPIALALASGIVLDAFVVRMTLVPSVMLLVGRVAWYLPRWLDRLLPNVDLEGSSLVLHRAEEAWAEGERDAVITADAASLAPPYDAPISLRLLPGQVTRIEVPDDARGPVIGMLTGRVAPASGHLQLGGHAMPGLARYAKRTAAPVIVGGGEAAVLAGIRSAAGSVGVVVVDAAALGDEAEARLAASVATLRGRDGLPLAAVFVGSASTAEGAPELDVPGRRASRAAHSATGPVLAGTSASLSSNSSQSFPEVAF